MPNSKNLPPDLAAKLIVRGIHLELTDALRAAIAEKTARLLRHNDHLVRLRVDLELDGVEHHLGRLFDHLDVDVHAPGREVQVIDGVDDYVALMQRLFDFDQIAALLQGNFPVAFDAMHAVTGPYATKIFEGLLGALGGAVGGDNPEAAA